MTRNEILSQVQRLSMFYDKFPVSQPIFNMWAEVFKSCDRKVFERAIDEAIKNEEFTPSIATIKRYCRDIELENRQIMEKAKECYLRAINALGIPKNMDEFIFFLQLINSEDRANRLSFAEDICSFVVNFANKQISEGKEAISFIELLKECSKRLQKNAD